MNQLHITTEIVRELEELANYKYPAYQKLISYAEYVSISRIKLRITELSKISYLKNDKKITDFDSFENLEEYILQNRAYYKLATFDISFAFKNFEIYKPIIIELFTQYIPELTGSNRDKIVSMISKRETVSNNYDVYTLRRILENLKDWYKNIDIFQFYGIDIEKFKNISDLSNSISQLPTFEKSIKFFKLLKPEMKKLIRKNPSQFLKLYITLQEKDHEYYRSLIDMSHEYTSLEEYFKDLKEHEVKLVVREVLQKLEKIKAKIIFKDNTSVAAHIYSFEQIKEVGAKAWCLTRNISDWTNYTHNSYFIIYWDFKELSESDKIIGMCISKAGGSVIHAQNKDNINIPRVKSEHIIKTLRTQIDSVIFKKATPKTVTVYNADDDFGLPKDDKDLIVNALRRRVPAPPEPPQNRIINYNMARNVPKKTNIFSKWFLD